MKNPTIYQLQSQVRRLSKTKKLAKKNAQKIKEIESQIYDIAVMQGKTYVATNYAKKQGLTKKEAVNKVFKDTGKVSYSDRKYIKPQLTPEQEFRKTVKANFDIQTARVLVNNKQKYGHLRGKTVNQIKEGIIDEYRNQLEGFKGIFKNTAGEGGVEENLKELYNLVKNDNNPITNMQELLRYTYDKVVFEKYEDLQAQGLYDPNEVDQSRYRADLDFFRDVSKEMVSSYKRLLKGRNIW